MAETYKRVRRGKVEIVRKNPDRGRRLARHAAWGAIGGVAGSGLTTLGILALTRGKKGVRSVPKKPFVTPPVPKAPVLDDVTIRVASLGGSIVGGTGAGLIAADRTRKKRKYRLGVL
jgi:hypothetical protein